MDASEWLWEDRPLDHWIHALAENPDDPSRWKAVDAIRHLAAPATSMPLLIGALDDPYWRVRALAAHAIEDLAYDEQWLPLVRQALPHLITTLSDANAVVTGRAARAIEVLGSDAESALPALNAMAGRDDAELQVTAIEVIRSIEAGESFRHSDRQE